MDEEGDRVMAGQAIILGSRPGSRNIGDMIARQLRGRGWVTAENDCLVSGEYLTPEESLATYDACVITLGYTSLTAIREVSDFELEKVIYGSLILPLMCARKYVHDRGSNGKIVFIGSYAHDHSLTGCSAYCAAKAGLAAAVKELAWELTPDFFTYIVHPYDVPSTPMGKAVVAGMIEDRGMTREEAKAYQAKDLKMGEHLKPQHIARVVHWLLTRTEATWLSGSGLDLYGGVR
jgi:NAD(P)-dependent dehydrogenase (short-subunit alcohol dehydrogenase family)